VILARLAIQTVFLALAQIWANKVRSLLTTLGIIIGVAAVIGTVSATSGLKRYVLTQFETFGARKIFMDGDVPRKYRGVISRDSVQLTLAELRAILKHCPSIDKLTPMFHSAYEVQNEDITIVGVQTIGIWPEWHEIEARSVTQGRQFNSIDEEQLLNVCLINDKAIEELALDKEPVGDFLLVAGQRFMIVGVVETKQLGMLFGGGDSQTEIYIPFSKAQSMRPDARIHYAIGQITEPEAAQDAIAEVRFVLRKMRALPPEMEDTFEIGVLQEIIDQFNSLAAGITIFMAGIVSISLLVGGIGIMNIMLVSVSERTREIGLRKAMGARPEVVLMQFLIEAVVLCLVGGAVGLLAGQLITLGLSRLPGLEEAAVPVWAIGLSVGFSAVTGIVFGMFPAIKAARLDPIVALRHE
jgi:putative ABC transport system permease protein